MVVSLGSRNHVTGADAEWSSSVFFDDVQLRLCFEGEECCISIKDEEGNVVFDCLEGNWWEDV